MTGTDMVLNPDDEGFEDEQVDDDGLVEDQEPEEDTETFEEPEGSLIDLQEYGDYLVPIVVDGEEQMVPLSELRGGYMRQADYTRKTQEVATARQQAAQAISLYQSLQADPAKTLRVLQASYADEAVDDGWEDPLDPEEERWQRFEQFMQQQQLRDLQQEILREVEVLKAQHGDFDTQEFLGFAADNGIDNLDIAYRAFAFDRVKNTAETEVKKVKRDAVATKRKRSAPPVAGGAGPQGGAVAEGGVKHPRDMSIAEMWEEAKAELGIS